MLGIEYRLTSIGKHRPTWRILAIVVCVAVFALTCQVVAHWHGSDYKDPHCQICHLSHATTFVLAAAALLQRPVALAPVTATLPFSPHQKLFASQGFSRAPPV
jgi:hypothetical protein